MSEVEIKLLTERNIENGLSVQVYDVGGYEVAVRGQKDLPSNRIFVYIQRKSGCTERYLPWYIHHMMRLHGLLDRPCGPEFAVRVEGHTALSARDFWKEVEFKYASEVLGVPVHGDEVIEIDDGLRPCFFHVVEDWDVNVLTFFKSDKARENQYEERSTL